MSDCENCFVTPCMCTWGGFQAPGVTVTTPAPVQAVTTPTGGRTARVLAAATTMHRSERFDDIDQSRFVSRFQWHMDQIPAILVAIREETVPLRATAYDANKVQASKGEAPAPANLHAVDDADELWAALVLFAREVSDVLHFTPPPALDVVWMHHGEVAGLPTGLSPRAVNTAAWAVKEWLLDLAGLIEFADVHAGMGHLFGVVKRTAGRWTPDGKPRRPRSRPCTLCGEVRVGVFYVDQDGADALVVECANCGATYEEGTE